MDVYQCKDCAVVVKSNSEPSSRNCPKSSFHHWQNLGEIGNKNYQCKDCGTLVQTKNEPSSRGCPKASFHHWQNLGET